MEVENNGNIDYRLRNCFGPYRTFDFIKNFEPLKTQMLNDEDYWIAFIETECNKFPY